MFSSPTASILSIDGLRSLKWDMLTDSTPLVINCHRSRFRIWLLSYWRRLAKLLWNTTSSCGTFNWPCSRQIVRERHSDWQGMCPVVFWRELWRFVGRTTVERERTNLGRKLRHRKCAGHMFNEEKLHHSGSTKSLKWSSFGTWITYGNGSLRNLGDWTVCWTRVWHWRSVEHI